MHLITTTADLADFCAVLHGERFVTVDTEFLRDRTYWAQLCLVQLAGEGRAAAIDPLADGIDLAPLFDLMGDAAVLKVFHAARQDVEILYHLSGHVPDPLFDTQVAAMVCGFGDSVGYETLASRLAGARIDKSSRFTDWSHRPLTGKQLDYALADVTHLRVVYEKLQRRLERSGRSHWVRQEMSVLSDPATYRTEPEDAWLRLRTRNAKPRFRAILREVAAWREREAQARDVPRSRVARDEVLLEVAAQTPVDMADLVRVRGIGRGLTDTPLGRALLEAVGRGRDLSADQCPIDESHQELPPGVAATVELLRVLLKMKSEENNVATRLIASSGDLEAIAVDDHAPVAALTGWRREVFGAEALALKHGKRAMIIAGNRVRLIPFESSAAGEPGQETGIDDASV